jgi:hypothetical protein
MIDLAKVLLVGQGPSDGPGPMARAVGRTARLRCVGKLPARTASHEEGPALQQRFAT